MSVHLGLLVCFEPRLQVHFDDWEEASENKTEQMVGRKVYCMRTSLYVVTGFEGF